MTLFRSIGRRQSPAGRLGLNLPSEWTAGTWPQEMPPRPRPVRLLSERQDGGQGPCDSRYDPCGAPPETVSRKDQDR